MAGKREFFIQADTRSPVRRFWDREVVGRYNDFISNDALNLPVQLLTGMRMDDPVTPGNLAALGMTVAGGAPGKIASGLRKAVTYFGPVSRHSRSVDKIGKLRSTLSVLESAKVPSGFSSQQELAWKAKIASETSKVRKELSAARSVAEARRTPAAQAKLQRAARVNERAKKESFKAVDKEFDVLMGKKPRRTFTELVKDHKKSAVALGATAGITGGSVVYQSGERKQQDVDTAHVNEIQTRIDRSWDYAADKLRKEFSDTAALTAYVRNIHSLMGQHIRATNGQQWEQAGQQAREVLDQIRGTDLWKRAVEEATVEHMSVAQDTGKYREEFDRLFPDDESKIAGVPFYQQVVDSMDREQRGGQ